MGRDLKAALAKDHKVAPAKDLRAAQDRDLKVEFQIIDHRAGNLRKSRELPLRMSKNMVKKGE